MILSGNSVEHALLALGAMYAGVYYAPIAPAYSLQAGSDFAALRHVFARVRPSLVFADDGAPFEGALDAVMTPDMELVSVTAPSRRAWTPFGDLTLRPATPDVDDATKRVGPDTIAKVLFTSGSTGHPKGVINTQRMLCSNQQQILDVLQFLGDEPPVLCDWLPWNHTAGGNHNFGIVLYNGGTMYIDDGKPVAALFDRTLRNLREIACTNHFTVPRFYEMLLPHLQRDAELREVFFRRLRLIFYAAAGLGQRFWDQLRDVSIEACGEELLIMTGMGMTESAPFLMCTGPRGAFAGMIGLPVPGVELKLVPVGEKVEGRVRGPNMTPGYLGEPGLTQNAFDDEGFYCTGDALSFVDPVGAGAGAGVRGAAGGGLQAVIGHMGQRRTAAGTDSGAGCRPRAGRRDCSPGSPVRRRADLSEHGDVPRPCRLQRGDAGRGARASQSCRRALRRSSTRWPRRIPALPPSSRVLSSSTNLHRAPLARSRTKGRST